MPASLTVLQVIHSTSGGGAEKQALLLNRHLNIGTTQSLLWCMRDNACAASKPENKIIVSGVSHRHPFRVVQDLRGMIRRYKPMVLHAWLPPPVTAPAMLAAFLEGVPAIYSYRNRMRLDDFRGFVEFLCASFFARGIVSNNPVDQSSLVYRILYGLKSGVMIPNATSLPSAIKNSHVGSSPPSIRLLAAGRLTRQKNFETLLSALEYVGNEIDWYCEIFGDGEDREKLEAILRAHKYAARITLNPFSTSLYLEMQKSDILVAPSWYEGSPNVVSEATHIGLPVIVSDIPAHRVLYRGRHDKWMHHPGDAGKLGKLLDTLIKNSTERYRISREQASLIVESSPKEMAARYIDYYRSVIGRHHRQD